MERNAGSDASVQSAGISSGPVTAIHAGINCAEDNRTTYQLTLLEDQSLFSQLRIGIAEFKDELTQFGRDLKNDPRSGVTNAVRALYAEISQARILAPHALAALTVILLVASFVVVFSRLNNKENSTASPADREVLELTEIIPNTEMVAARRGVENSHGKGAVGVNTGRGKGSESRSKEAHGGGGGGQQDKSKAQVGNIPPPSPIPAMIPKLPPVQPIMLPTAGVDLDKALYRDMKYDRFGDPTSRTNATSAGPGRFGGIGSSDGTGIGVGDGPGVGNGDKGNTGGGPRDPGGGGPGLARDGGPAPDYHRIFIIKEVTQKARIISKPEPQYTEEARKNQITGTVVLRAVLGSGGEVTGIKAISLLPFGLTEKAISAAKQIKFTPAVKDGHTVSQYIQIEYNFNLY